MNSTQLCNLWQKKECRTLKTRGTLFSKVAATYSSTLWAVPSAWLGLTSLFGMGRGGTPAL